MRNSSSGRILGRYTWDRLSVNFLFIPTIMAIGAVLLTLSMYWLDVQIPNEVLSNNRFIVSGSAGELRDQLINMTLAILTTAGMVFTLLTLVVSIVAAQFGSRLLRMFLADHTTQVVLGIFLATFAYCISGAMITPIAGSSEGPQLTATLGLYLLIAAFASIILLVQHIGIMLQAPNIAAAAGEELLEGVREANWAEVRGSEGQPHIGGGPPGSLKETEAHPVRASATGYIQYIDPEDILHLVETEDLFIRVVHKPGDFVRSGLVLALVWPADRVDRELDKKIWNTFHLGNQRTPTQDIEYAVNQLSEMAVRAMSPAINDPFTAITCLDFIGTGLAEFARQGAISPNIHDRHGRLRLVFDPFTFGDLLSAAFDMLRHASADNAEVLFHMLDTIDVIGQETKTPDMRQELLRHVTLVRMESQAGSLIVEDRQAIHRRSEALQVKLTGPV